ncbi:hypothetical protein Fot_12015 [Forsythia ovata]|uniref:Uncharacterized protein n=1 Tax=Forsythia ovata TaxID=205694 RepID=A0ABD1WLB8_9LAMI
MYTFRNHVLNSLRVENKDLRGQLVFSEDAKARAMYDVIKARTIQKACVKAQKTAESQLKSCQNTIYAKDKELTEVLSELSKAQGLLAKLGVPVPNPRVRQGRRNHALS